MLTVTIPFSGFYESKWSGILDSELEQWIEYTADERQAEDGIAEPLRLSAHELGDLTWRHTRFQDGYALIAADYVEAWNDAASEKLEFPLGLKFESMDSPKYYNFETDRLFAYMTKKTARRLFSISKKEDHRRLRAAIRECFTGRDGFIPHYSNDITDWITKPLADWDHNELGTLLAALVEVNDWDFYYSIAEQSYAYFDKAMDWESLDAAIEEAREEKRLELLEEDPDWEPPYRCDKTPDMFRDWVPA